MKPTGGIVYIKHDGDPIKVKGDVAYNLGLPVREPQVNMDGSVDYTEKPQAAMIKFTSVNDSEVVLEDILAIKGATVTAELNNGKTIVLKDAFAATEGEVNGEDGSYELTFYGSDCSEVK